MPDLPAGTVTFLFSDIEGSTQLLHALRDDYAGVLADERAVAAMRSQLDEASINAARAEGHDD